ncbi:hypothetical protein NPIL_579831 [Nephila pilipes]|uniref:Spider venom protein n=1 Tax=Nephila pilipes TaxID=299642 RepID=A0A8X6U022_NEPPI|nr:hypothetical protein NPIL_579831 [Nephila pilipes]
MKFSFFFFVTTVWIFFSDCAQTETCKEFTRKKIFPTALSIIGREDAPACSETDMFLKLIESFDTEDEMNFAREYKKMYSESEEEKKKEIKECLNKAVEIIVSEVGEIPEECEGETQAWADYLTA